jgi:RNase P subunit RPR2
MKKYHGAAAARSIPPFKISRLYCQHCEDLIIAAARSEYVSSTEINHWWACETCGHQFRTTVRWPRAFVDHEPAAGETLPEWNLPRGLR